MAQPNKLQFIINPGAIDQEVISQSPENWLNTSIKQTRSKVYNGLFRGETSPTAYVLNSAFLLRRAYYQNGIKAFVQNQINLQNPNTWQYNNIYKGVLDFSNAVDSITSFTVPSISDDFSVQLAANDSTTYAIPLDVSEAINLELTPLALKEQATIIAGAPPDGNIHSDYYPPISVAYNQQNSVNYSTKAVQYDQFRNPDFSASTNNFFFSRVDGKLLMTGTISFALLNLGALIGPQECKLHIVNQNGDEKYIFYHDNIPASPYTQVITQKLNNVINVSKGEKLFLYMQQVGSETAGTGITITASSIDFKYETISPATMTKALPAFHVFRYLLQAMNTNLDSGPNQPVPFKSDLLNGPMANLVITSSDSIKNGLGSLFYTGDTLFPGSYKVLSGPIVYGGNTFNTGDTFAYSPNILTFSGTGGIVERVVSGFVGSVYNPGDTLQAGGTYLVGGDAGTYVTYNAINYNVGQFFTYVLGFDTFTGSDDTSFVQQTGVAPQLLINFRDAWQSIYSVQGGNCSFGIENGICFIENLDYVYRATVGNLNVGVVDKEIKIQPATDMIGNTLIVGYKDQQYSQLNGFSEVNSQQNYGTSLVNPKKEINLVSIWRADPFGIEEIRVSQNDTASSRSDNDTFMVYKKTLPENEVSLPDIGFYYHPLRTETLTSITGVDPSYYNWILSPKQNLLRGSNYLASMYYGMKGYKITLTGAPKNTAMVTIDNTGRRVSEADPIFISTLPNPLYIPIYVTMKPGLPKNTLQMIDNLPYGFFTFTFNNKRFKAFADTFSVDIGENTEQEIKGLLTPDNDLSQFVH